MNILKSILPFLFPKPKSWEMMYYDLKDVVKRQKKEIERSQEWEFYSHFFQLDTSKMSRWEKLRLEVEQERNYSWNEIAKLRMDTDKAKVEMDELYDIKEKYIHLKASVKVLRLNKHHEQNTNS